MTESTLQSQLQRIALAHTRIRLSRWLAFCWAGAALSSGLALLLHKATGWWSPQVLPILLGATALAAGITWLRARRNVPAYRWIAQQIEREDPKLKTLLLAAVEQQPDKATGQLNYLQERVILEALRANQDKPWVQKPTERLFFAQCSQWAAFALFAGIWAALAIVTPRGASALNLAQSRSVTITPGNTTLERGSSFVVLARFRDRMPAKATLVLRSAADKTQRIPLAKNLDDPVFGGSVPEVKADATYLVEYDESQSETFQVKVFDFPALRRADAQLNFPEYTGLPAKKIEDTRRLSAVEGTVVDYSFQLNKPVATAQLVAKDKSVLPLVPDPGRSNVYHAKLTLAQSQRYELHLMDDAGRTNKTPSDILIDVLPNRPPELKLASPRRDIRVSPLEEVTFQAQASDDFGLQSYGLAYTLAGQETKFIELGKMAPATEKRQLDYLLSLEELVAEPDQLLTYYIWADDLGPDGKIRRTSGDMYFAEVRPFEEIFREGQPPSANEESNNQNSNGQSSQSEKLAELQKQIINATWKLQRRETAAKPSAEFKKDATVVQESQEKALEQAREMRSKAENPRLKPFIETALKEMEKALDQLTESTAKNSTKPLPPALAAEQSAYQALMKLQAREYEVTRNRNRNQQSASQASQRAQQQVDQLELKQTENRYETQRQASSPQNPEQREQLQVLNRLKELAQRQQDLNERLKELQTALQEAKTEQERDAVRRQLKRLREEEQEVLSDVDELRQRMNRPENQGQMAEARDRLEQTRSEVRRAAEQLEQEAVSQALASGTRAQRDLQQLRDDFRKKTSSQFSEEMRQMRSEARQLAQNEDEIGQKLESMSRAPRKSLNDSAERGQLAGRLNEQRSGFTNLLNNMRQVTEQAEAAEPLLAKQLYDTVRKTDQGKFNGAVTNTSELLRRGFVPQAIQLERQTRPILDELKSGVERAAESVLGDEGEALRMARNELDELTRQIEEEMARSDTNQSASAQSGSPTAGQRPTAQANAGRGGTNSPSASAQNKTNGQPASAQNGGPSDPSRRSPGANPQDRAQAGAPGSSPRDTEQQAQSAQSGQGQRSGQRGGQRGGGRGGEPQQASAAQPGTPQRRSLGDPSANNNPRTAQNQGGQRGQRGGQPGGQPGGQRGGQPGGLQNLLEGGGSGGGGTGPLTGAEYTNWSDRLRDVEEMVDSPELRNRLAQVRDRARGMRAEFKRHSKEPQWALVRAEIAGPLAEVRSRINEELARRSSNDSLVPIDRDPVPNKYSELVRRYYEKLGSSE